MFSIKEFDVKIKNNKISKNYILDRGFSSKEEIYSEINNLIEKSSNWNWEKYGMPHMFNTNGEVYYLHPVKFDKIEKYFFEIGGMNQNYLFSVNKDLFSFYYRNNALDILKIIDIDFYKELESFFKRKIKSNFIYALGIDYKKEDILSKKIYLDGRYIKEKDISIIEEKSAQKIKDLRVKYKLNKDLEFVGINNEKKFAFYFLK